MTTPNTDLNWTTDTRDSWALRDASGVRLCLERTFPVRFTQGRGLALYTEDRTQPGEWTCYLYGDRSANRNRSLGTPGMSVREAKKLALEHLAAV